MRETNARSSRKAKAPSRRPYTTAPMFGSTRDVSWWKSQALAGFPTFLATVLSRYDSAPGPEKDQPSNRLANWSGAGLSPREPPHRSAKAIDRLIRNSRASGFAAMRTRGRALLGYHPRQENARAGRLLRSMDELHQQGPPRRASVPLEVNHN